MITASKKYWFWNILIMIAVSCQPNKKTGKTVELVTLDPGHFHAALVQKTMYDNVDSVVHVYAPPGADLQAHLARVNGYNSRKEHPTSWKEEVYTGNDFFEKMIAEKKGNVVVLSGNNQRKSDYILQSLQNGFHVLADKPMAIDKAGFEKLKQAFDTARKNNLLLYDIMTERYEITTILQRELSMIPEIFGTLENGTMDDPGVVMLSVHHFYKYVSGNVLTRPAWFFDASQQGEALTDVMTHLVDLAQWQCFPEQAIDYSKDIELNSARHWTTDISLDEFKTVTKADSFPSYLIANVTDNNLLQVFYNGEINYTVRGVHVKTSALWNYKAAEGAGDLYSAIMRGTKANLIIRQGIEENYQPTLYIEPRNTADEPHEAFKKIQAKYPGIEVKKTTRGWQVIIPAKYKEGHEEHFGRVTQHFLEYLENKNMPEWEVPNMLTKYFITTRALEMALKIKQ